MRKENLTLQKIIMNELDYISKLKEKGNLGENIRYTVGLLAKYYRSQGDDIDTIKRKLNADLHKYEPELKNKQIDTYIAGALNIIDKRKLNTINEVVITQSEINKIMSITTCRDGMRVSSLRRLAFALLCFAKFEMAKGSSEPWVNYDLRYIFKAAKLTGFTKSRCNLCLHELYTKGFIELNNKIDSLSIKVVFADKTNNDIALRVGDINYSGDYFWQFMGRKYIECQSCGKPVPRTNNRILYCADCAAVINREKTRQRMTELRKK